MHIPNNRCQLALYLGIDKKSEPIYKKPNIEGCSIITYRLEQVPTPLRSDTSASQGRATIKKGMIRVMLLANTRANFGSKFNLVSRPDDIYKLIEIHPRYDALGKVDHYQCDLEKL
jgi:hypothetical protein